MKKLSTILISSILTICLFAGCGCSAEQKQSKTISTDGSTSMEKVIGYLSEAYMNENKDIKITYNPTGSGSGIKAVAEGRCDIGLSSRSLKDEEKQTLTETTIAIDAIAVTVNPKNSVSSLSLEQLSSIYTGEISNWKDLGGDDAPIVLIGREAASGTRDGFESITNTSHKCKYTQELTSTGDVIQTVASNPNAIGYVSLASVKESVKIISIDNVYPSKETVQNGSYKIQRDFIFVTRKDAELSESAKAFFDYAASENADALIEKSGAIPVSR